MSGERIVTYEHGEFDLNKLPDGYYLIYRDGLEFPVHPMAKKEDLTARIEQLPAGSVVNLSGPLKFLGLHERKEVAA